MGVWEEEEEGGRGEDRERGRRDQLTSAILPGEEGARGGAVQA